MTQALSTNVIRAAGGVLWRTVAGTKGDSVEVAIIHRPRYDDWSIPKGKLNISEIEIEGGVREVTEETGYRPTIVSPLGEVSYLKEGRPKVVRYWSMRAERGLFTPGREVDELRWLSVDDAVGLVSAERDRDVLQRFVSVPTGLRTILLVRHALAGTASPRRFDDDERPLDDIGLLQADALIRLLTCWDVREIHTAPIVRCTQTVAPLAGAVGLMMQDQPLLLEQGFSSHRQEVIDWVRHAGHADTATVLCSQGGVIPEVLTRLALEDQFELPHPRPCKKGSVWALTFSDQKLHAAEYFPPLV